MWGVILCHGKCETGKGCYIHQGIIKGRRFFPGVSQLSFFLAPASVCTHAALSLGSGVSVEGCNIYAHFIFVCYPSKTSTLAAHLGRCPLYNRTSSANLPQGSETLRKGKRRWYTLITLLKQAAPGAGYFGNRRLKPPQASYTFRR